MNAAKKYIEYIEEKVNNKQKIFECCECNEPDEKMYKGFKVLKDFNKALEKKVFYICEFHAKLKFGYYFKSKSKSKSKELNLFKVAT